MTGQGGGPVVVVGYGNTLRGDDAIGRIVAESIAEHSLPNVVAISTTQLMPELAKRIADARAAIFVDARMADGEREVKVQKLEASESVRGASHTGGPRELLALAQACYGQAPPAWMVAVPAQDFGMLDQVASPTRSRIAEAVQVVQQLIQSLERQSQCR